MIRLTNVTKSFGARVLFDDISYHFPQGEKLALVGANGAGKTTLLNVLCGFDHADSGNIIKPANCTLGYLAQKPNENPKPTVLEECLSGAESIMKLKDTMDHALANMETDHEKNADIYEEAEAAYRNSGGYQLEAKAHGILKGLGFSEKEITDSPAKLSGGWRMRVELAKLFISDPDLLILDEPTNHLDLPSLVWVENFLEQYRGTLLFVSHDLALLNRLPRRILHLNDGILREYHGNFDKFLAQREIIQEQTASQLDNLRKKREQMQVFVDRFGAKATKAAQAQSRMKMIDKIKNMESGLSVEDDAASIFIDIPPPAECSRVVLSVVSGATGYKSILSRNINLSVEKGAKVAIIGANGIGKSTLLKTIAGITPNLGGEWTKGANVNISYFSQDQRDTLDKNKTVIENLLSASNISERDGRSLLGSLLFRGDDVKKVAKVLSGGELSRLALAICLAKKANLLILDEPTNHLDMSSVSMLSNSLDSWAGTVLFVSHDRNFIDEVCTHIFVVLGDGRTHLFAGKLEDYCRMAKLSGFPDVMDPESMKAPEAPTPKGASVSGIPATTQKAEQVSEEDIKQMKRQRQKLTTQLKDFESTIQNLRKKVAELELRMTSLPPQKYSEAAATADECQKKNAEIEETEMKWLEASDELEGINAKLQALGRA
jgi:ATP-binding cassette subfamily F protein 3